MVRFTFNEIIPTFERLQSGVTEFIRENPLISGAGIGLGSAGALAGLVAVVRRRRTRKATTRRRTRRRLTARQRKVRRIKKRKGRQSPYTAGARKDRSTRRIRYTKKGQPYVITRSGKAKFIKKSSAKRSHRRKGGRY